MMEEVFEQHRIARAEQGYALRAGTCGTCAKLDFDVRLEQGSRPYNQYESIPVRSNYRCSIGGFAVVTVATCKQYEAKPSVERKKK